MPIETIAPIAIFPTTVQLLPISPLGLTSVNPVMAPLVVTGEVQMDDSTTSPTTTPEKAPMNPTARIGSVLVFASCPDAIPVTIDTKTAKTNILRMLPPPCPDDEP